jgi:hypothetical protein
MPFPGVYRFIVCHFKDMSKRAPLFRIVRLTREEFASCCEERFEPRYGPQAGPRVRRVVRKTIEACLLRGGFFHPPGSNERGVSDFFTVLKIRPILNIDKRMRLYFHKGVSEIFTVITFRKIGVGL